MGPCDEDRHEEGAAAHVFGRDAYGLREPRDSACRIEGDAGSVTQLRAEQRVRRTTKRMDAADVAPTTRDILDRAENARPTSVHTHDRWSLTADRNIEDHESTKTTKSKLDFAFFVSFVSFVLAFTMVVRNYLHHACASFTSASWHLSTD